jgi:phosphoadenosine phosphosulfate reductase
MQIKDYAEQLQGKSAEEILSFVAIKFAGQITFASSMGVEDQVITDMIVRLKLNIPIFTLDTGRLFPETYQLISTTTKHYKFDLQIFFPDAETVEAMVNSDGINLFYNNETMRKKCCMVRKVMPLQRALAPYAVWLCGLRSEQSITRNNTAIIMNDKINNMLKINPLHDWSEEQIWDYIHRYDVPYNSLHDKHFASIGCACCTRAVENNSDPRSGRWWWENPETRECGLHLINGKLQRELKE